MIKRIVKMVFIPESINQFLDLFDEKKDKIRHFEGCHHLELWKDTQEKNVLFTFSIWEDETKLNHYRTSDLFKDTWSKTKILFDKKAEAWSVTEERIL